MTKTRLDAERERAQVALHRTLRDAWGVHYLLTGLDEASFEGLEENESRALDATVTWGILTELRQVIELGNADIRDGANPETAHLQALRRRIEELLCSFDEITKPLQESGKMTCTLRPPSP